MRGYFDNSARLARLMLRRERFITGIWLAVFLFLSTVIPGVLNTQFGSPKDLLALRITMQNPAMIAMMGPVYGADNYTVGAMYSNMMLLLTLVASAIMNIFLVARHTRADEEKGRLEVIRSLPVGRLANIHGAMLTALIVNAAMTLCSGPVMLALNIKSIDLSGSLLYGAAIGATGLFFAAVAAVFCQLSNNSRGASGYSFAFLGLCYLARAVGDINHEPLSRLSPLGLILRAQVFVKNAWWPLWVILALTALVTAATYYLCTQRDMDQGFIPVKPGRKRASALLQGPFGLTARLTRNMILAWAIGMFLFGASYGSVMGDVESFISHNALFQLMLPKSPDYSTAELFITMLNIMLALSCVAPVYMALFKLRGEEKDHRAEHILGRAVSRYRYLAGYVIIAFIACALMPFMAVVGLWSASAPVMDTPVAFGSMLKAMMAYVPALWLMLGLAVLCLGLWPRGTSVCWAYFGYAFFSAYMGRMLGIPEWALKLSPFGFIPMLPLEPIHPPTLLIMSALAFALTGLGFVLYRRRDMRA